MRVCVCVGGGSLTAKHLEVRRAAAFCLEATAEVAHGPRVRDGRAAVRVEGCPPVREHLARGPAGFAVGALVKAHHHQKPTSSAAAATSASWYKSWCSDPPTEAAADAAGEVVAAISARCRPKGAGERRRRGEDKAAEGVVPVPAPAPAPPAPPALRCTRRPLPPGESLECCVGSSARVCAGVYAGGGRRRGQRRLLASYQEGAALDRASSLPAAQSRRRGRSTGWVRTQGGRVRPRPKP